LFVDIKISSPSNTGKDDVIFPFLGEFIIPNNTLSSSIGNSIV